MTGTKSATTSPLAAVVMGVTGSGKTALGHALAERLDAVFIEGDDLHPADNVARMARGEPLTDDLRAGWLDAIGRAIANEIDGGRSVVATCSALKRAYRDRLRGFSPDIVFLYLKIDPVTARARVATRRDHFMPASLVESQFAILEEPAPAEQAETLDATLAVDTLEERARKRLSQP